MKNLNQTRVRNFIVNSVSPVVEAGWVKGKSVGLDVSAATPMEMDGEAGAFLLADAHDNFIGVQHTTDDGKGYDITLTFDKYNKLSQSQLQELAMLIIGTSSSADNLIKMGFKRNDY
jgi:hypothetical protein